MRCPSRFCRSDLVLEDRVTRTARVGDDGTARAAWRYRRCGEGHVLAGSDDGVPAELFELEFVVTVHDLVARAAAPTARVRRPRRGVDRCRGCGADPLDLVESGTVDIDATVNVADVAVELQLSAPRFACSTCDTFPTGGPDLHPTEDIVERLWMGLLNGWVRESADADAGAPSLPA